MNDNDELVVYKVMDYDCDYNTVAIYMNEEDAQKHCAKNEERFSYLKTTVLQNFDEERFYY